MQSKRMSLIEVCCSTAFGFIVAYCSQLVVFPHYHIQVDHAVNLQITIWFTFISVARSYVFRRVFNAFTPTPRHVRVLIPPQE